MVTLPVTVSRHSLKWVPLEVRIRWVIVPSLLAWSMAKALIYNCRSQGRLTPFLCGCPVLLFSIDWSPGTKIRTQVECCATWAAPFVYIWS